MMPVLVFYFIASNVLALILVQPRAAIPLLEIVVLRLVYPMELIAKYFVHQDTLSPLRLA